jgi:hypothetical protein
VGAKPRSTRSRGEIVEFRRLAGEANGLATHSAVIIREGG